MTESRPYRHTPGEWGRHKNYDVKLGSIENDDGSVRCYADTMLSSGDKIIAEVQMRTGNCGWPHVENMIEFKANLALMSAAPNLLEGAILALEIAEDFIHAQFHGVPEKYDPAMARLQPVREAIAKATTY